MELAPLLVVVPRVVRAHAEPVPHRQRRLVAGDDRARGVLRALRAIFVLEEEQVALACVEIKILRRVRAESSRRPPRHRRDACSTAWRCEFLTARPSQDGRVVAAPDTLVDFYTDVDPLEAPRRDR